MPLLRVKYFVDINEETKAQAECPGNQLKFYPIQITAGTFALSTSKIYLLLGRSFPSLSIFLPSREHFIHHREWADPEALLYAFN